MTTKINTWNGEVKDLEIYLGDCRGEEQECLVSFRYEVERGSFGDPRIVISDLTDFRMRRDVPNSTRFEFVEAAPCDVLLANLRAAIAEHQDILEAEEGDGI